MYVMECKFKGLVHCMINRYPMPEKQGERKKKRKLELKDKVYLDKKGMYIPADNIRMMLIGNQFRKGAAEILGKYIESKRGAEYRTFCQSCVWVVGKEDPEKVYFEPKRKIWDATDVRSFVTANKNRDIVERPLVCTPWSLAFLIHVVDDNFPPEKIKELFEVAGLRCGVGVYGPKFGRCLVDYCKVVESKKK